MATREDVLRSETFKENGLSLEERVFYTLTQNDALQPKRTVKAISLLVAILKDRGVMTDDEVDEFLFSSIR
jgi:hypothetical protein